MKNETPIQPLRGKDFASKPKETLEAFKSFYFNDFWEMLLWYYPDKINFNQQLVILSAAGTIPQQEQIQILRSQFRRLHAYKQFFFSVSVFFTCLIPQVLKKAIEPEAMEAFYKASGWPRMSAGLGGQISAELWLKESELYPSQDEESWCYTRKEASWYNSLLDIVDDFFIQEVTEFLNGGKESVNPAAYKTLVDFASGKIELVEQTLRTAILAAKRNFAIGKAPTYFGRD